MGRLLRCDFVVFGMLGQLDLKVVKVIVVATRRKKFFGGVGG